MRNKVYILIASAFKGQYATTNSSSCRAYILQCRIWWSRENRVLIRVRDDPDCLYGDRCDASIFQLAAASAVWWSWEDLVFGHEGRVPSTNSESHGQPKPFGLGMVW